MSFIASWRCSKGIRTRRFGTQTSASGSGRRPPLYSATAVIAPGVITTGRITAGQPLSENVLSPQTERMVMIFPEYCCFIDHGDRVARILGPVTSCKSARSRCSLWRPWACRDDTGICEQSRALWSERVSTGFNEYCELAAPLDDFSMPRIEVDDQNAIAIGAVRLQSGHDL